MRLRLTMIITAVVLFFLPVKSQENNYLTFMGIPISGNINDFIKNLEDKGFILNEDEGDNITLTGKFTNQDVLLVLLQSDKTNDISGVGVAYNPVDSWSLLEQSYDNLLTAYSKKYGKPTTSLREIPSTYNDSGNYIFLGFKNDNVEYSDTWDLPSGAILITIVPNSLSSACIFIVYKDMSSLMRENEQIMDDI